MNVMQLAESTYYMDSNVYINVQNKVMYWYAVCTAIYCNF